MPKKEFYRITVDGIPYVVEVEPIYSGAPQPRASFHSGPLGACPPCRPSATPVSGRAEGANSSSAPL